MRLSSLLLGIVLLTGCATTEPERVIYKTEYQEVYVPVMYKLTRPPTPAWDEENGETLEAFIQRYVTYTKRLEAKIDSVGEVNDN